MTEMSFYYSGQYYGFHYNVYPLLIKWGREKRQMGLFVMIFFHSYYCGFYYQW